MAISKEFKKMMEQTSVSIKQLNPKCKVILDDKSLSESQKIHRLDDLKWNKEITEEDYNEAIKRL